MNYFLLKRSQSMWRFTLCNPRGARLLRSTAHTSRDRALSAIAALRGSKAYDVLCRNVTSFGGAHYFTISVPGRLSLATSNYFETLEALQESRAFVAEAARTAPVVEERNERENGTVEAAEHGEVRATEPLCRLEALISGYWLVLRDDRGKSLMATLAKPHRAGALASLNELYENAPLAGQYGFHTTDSGKYSFRLKNSAGVVFAASSLYADSEQRDLAWGRCLACAAGRVHLDPDEVAERSLALWLAS